MFVCLSFDFLLINNSQTRLPTEGVLLLLAARCDNERAG